MLVHLAASNLPFYQSFLIWICAQQTYVEVAKTICRIRAVHCWKKVLGSNPSSALFSPCLLGFSKGTLFPPIAQRHVVSVSLSVNGCLSLCFKPGLYSASILTVKQYSAPPSFQPEPCSSLPWKDFKKMWPFQASSLDTIDSVSFVRLPQHLQLFSTSSWHTSHFSV